MVNLLSSPNNPCGHGDDILSQAGFRLVQVPVTHKCHSIAFNVYNSMKNNAFTRSRKYDASLSGLNPGREHYLVPPVPDERFHAAALRLDAH